MLSDIYYEQVLSHIKELQETQGDALKDAAKLIGQAFIDRKRTFAFGSGHASLPVQEIFCRAGGLCLYNPIFIPDLHPCQYPYTRAFHMERVSGVAEAAIEAAPVSEGDVIIVVSTAGRNHAPIEMAMEAKKRGMQVIALTSVAFSKGVPSRHPSGKRLFDIADVVLDNLAPLGDACVEVPGIPAKAAPLSGILCNVVLHSLECAICDYLVDAGVKPPVFMSGNRDDTDEYNYGVVGENEDVITFL